MSARVQHPTEAVCPPWCEGHDGHFQAWEELVDGSGVEREHEGHAATLGFVSLYAAQTETQDGMGPARVRVYVDSHLDDSLTPAQARELARRLTMLAEEVEARA